jgi:hypothetical protein
MASAGGALAGWRPGKLGVADVNRWKFSASLDLLDYQFGPSASKFNKLDWICLLRESLQPTQLASPERRNQFRVLVRQIAETSYVF